MSNSLHYRKENLTNDGTKLFYYQKIHNLGFTFEFESFKIYKDPSLQNKQQTNLSKYKWK